MELAIPQTVVLPGAGTDNPLIGNLPILLPHRPQSLLVPEIPSVQFQWPKGTRINDPLHCTVIHCTALHCTKLHCHTLLCTALHYTALSYTALHCTALHCHTLVCLTLYCLTLHCTALTCVSILL